MTCKYGMRQIGLSFIVVLCFMSMLGESIAEDKYYDWNDYREAYKTKIRIRQHNRGAIDNAIIITSANKYSNNDDFVICNLHGKDRWTQA